MRFLVVLAIRGEQQGNARNGYPDEHEWQAYD